MDSRDLVGMERKALGMKFSAYDGVGLFDQQVQGGGFAFFQFR